MSSNLVMECFNVLLLKKENPVAKTTSVETKIVNFRETTGSRRSVTRS
jgi:hypothetical protein